MPSDHLACNKGVWDGLTAGEQRIMDTAMQKLSLHTAISNEKANNEAAAALREQGVSLYAWSDEDKAKFRAGAQKAWGRLGPLKHPKQQHSLHRTVSIWQTRPDLQISETAQLRRGL